MHRLKSESLREYKINKMATRVGHACRITHLHYTGSDQSLYFLANRKAELAVSLSLWPVNCIKIGGGMLSDPYSLYCIYEYLKDFLSVHKLDPKFWRINLCNISRIILVYYCKCCNLIGYSTRYLFLDR